MAWSMRPVSLLVAVLFFSGSHPASGYQFVKIADEAAGFAPFDSTPSINDGGEVAFYNGGSTVVVGTAASFKRIAGTSCAGPSGALYCTEPEAGRPFTSFSPTSLWPSISNRGSVAFHAAFAGGEGIYRFDPPSTLTKIVDTDDAPGFAGLAHEVAMNNAGTVAFLATSGPSTSSPRVALYTGNGGSLTLRADTSGPISALGYIAINDGGTVFFSAVLDSGAEAVATDPGGIRLQTGDSCGGFVIEDTGHTSIADNGVMVFGALSRPGGDHGYLVFDGSSCTPHLWGPFEAQAWINSVGSISWTDSGSAVLRDGQFVVATGDALCGGTVGPSVSVGREAQNDRGWMAFKYLLQTGPGATTGIAIAFPEGDEHLLGPGVSVVDCALVSASPSADQDGDGESDSTDLCPGTPASAPVDEAGCSQSEFCARVSVTALAARRTCKRSDWRNDEPLMILPAQDCTVARNGTAILTDDLCVPTP